MKVQIIFLLLLVASAWGKEFKTVGLAADGDLSYLTDPSCAPESDFAQTKEK